MSEAAPDGVELARCAGCGVRALIVDGVPVNAEDHDVPPLCTERLGGNLSIRRRAHGPWLPVAAGP